MRYRELGRTGLLVSEIGMGCEGFAEDISMTGTLFDEAERLGINYFDLAAGDGKAFTLWGEALADVRKGRGHGFPRQLQNVHADTYTQERSQGYLYPHDFPNHWVKQQYLPDDIKNAKYYEYGPNKLEQAAKAYWDLIKGGT